MIKQLVELSRDESKQHQPKELRLVVWQLDNHREIKDEIRSIVRSSLCTRSYCISHEYEDADSLKTKISPASDSLVTAFEDADWKWD